MDAGNNKAMRGWFHIYLHCWSGGRTTSPPHTYYRIRALPASIMFSMNLSVAPRTRNTLLVRAPTCITIFKN